MSTLEKLAEMYGIPVVGAYEARHTPGWIANDDSTGIELRELVDGKLVLTVYVSVRFFLDYPLQVWPDILKKVLQYPEEAIA